MKKIARLAPVSSVKPDFNRVKQFLEQFSYDSLQMVGSLNLGGTLWALVQDSEGGVHRVKEGDYLGRNHGKIVSTLETQLSVIEIVPTGDEDSWMERPRTMKVRGLD